MRKLLYIFILCISPIVIYSQNGSGTELDPYYGTISGNVTWVSGRTVYIGITDITLPYDDNDLRISNGGHLTIESGVTVIFKQSASDMIITGTGRLTADGTSAGLILFTRYYPTNNYWGHISFENMDVSAGASLIDNCIIEYGYKYSGNSEILSYGGGLHVGFSNILITNNIIRNNHAGWGGGVFINAYSHPQISNCNINNNTSVREGAGIYIAAGSHSLISNNVISYNSATGNGGGLFIGGALAVKIINCTIVKNTAAKGANLELALNNDPTYYPTLTNCIVWSLNSSIYYAQQTPKSSDFINCAIQTPVIGSTTNCITLNATNTDPAGPNFLATDGTNWLIEPWSPCVDIGNGTDPNVPATDYVGNGRIGPVDVGAYESQFYKWQGDDGSNPGSWGISENWNSSSVPPTGASIFIPSGLSYYPINAAPDITIGSGNTMILQQGARATLGNLTNNGSLKLNATSAGFASLIINSYTRGGGASEVIQLYLTGGGSELLEDYKWHYISSPVTTLSTNTFTGVTLDLAQFVESRPALSLLQGWVAYDGYVYSTGLSNGPTFSSLTPGKGYNFWDGVNNTFSFGGLLNTSDAAMVLPYSGVPSKHGFNLLGNPFSSGLNWDNIVNSVYFTYPSNTSKGVYFTKDNIQCTYIGGVGTPAGVTGIIPPMQGFFTKTYSTGNTITLPAAARTHTNIHSTYKGSGIIPIVRLQISKDTINYDETVVRFDDLAKSELDYDFDAQKMFISSAKTQIYSSVGGTSYAINGLPFPETFVEIPIVFSLTKDTIHTISATQLEGLDNYDVTLKDNTTGFTADLKTTPVLTFSAAPGTTIADRFVLKISTITTGTDDHFASKNIFNIYQGNDLINIQTISDEWEGKTGTVRVLDLAGKTITDLQNTEFRKNSLTQVQAPAARGLYLVEIRTALKRYVGKVVIR